MPKKTRKKVVLLGTGGTIAGLSGNAYDNVGYTAAQVGITELLDALPRPPGFSCKLTAEQIVQLDSKDMSFEVWQKLARRCRELLVEPEVQAIVITHGTDTMEETAFFLHLVLSGVRELTKPVVLTGAMRPSSALVPDGPQNLLDALAFATYPGVSGVVVAFAGKVHGAVEVQKVHSYRLDAFDSVEKGPVAYVEEGAVRMACGLPCNPAAPTGFNVPTEVAVWPRVEIVMSHAGAGPLLVDSMLEQGAHNGDPVKGIVVAATGNGSLHSGLEVALLRAQASGVVVIRASRCAGGQVLAGPHDAFPHSNGLSAVKARIALMLRLMQPGAVLSTTGGG